MEDADLGLERGGDARWSVEGRIPALEGRDAVEEPDEVMSALQPPRAGARRLEARTLKVAFEARRQRERLFRVPIPLSRG